MESITSIVSVISGIIAIIGGGYAFFVWIKDNLPSRYITNVIVRNGNVFCIYKNGNERQLTFECSDSNPLLLKKKSKIVFLRSEKVRFDKEYTRYKIVGINTSSFEEYIIVDQKPFWDGLGASFDILQPRDLKISKDQKSLYLIIEKYATASELVQIDIVSGKFTELFSAEKYDIITSGKYKRNFLVGVSDIGENGRDIFYRVLNFKGETLKKFNSEADYMEFRSEALLKK